MREEEEGGSLMLALLMLPLKVMLRHVWRVTHLMKPAELEVVVTGDVV